MAEMLPPRPSSTSPVLMRTRPEFPYVERPDTKHHSETTRTTRGNVPVRSWRHPLTPRGPLSSVATVTLPELVATPNPDSSAMEPPLEVAPWPASTRTCPPYPPAPAVANALPPTLGMSSSKSSVSPALTKMSAPRPLSPSPTIQEIFPPAPPRVVPVLSVTLPVFPKLEVPVKSSSSPLVPTFPAFCV